MPMREILLGPRNPARRWVRAASMAAAVLALVACKPEKQAASPEIGPADSFKPVISDLMAKWGIPGGAVGLVKDGRLVMAEGYGFADRERGRTAQADSLFRIASLSKPITAVAALKLVEEGRLGLDDKAFRLLDDMKPPPGAFFDPRLTDITVRDLLRHSGGFDRAASGDPMFKPMDIAGAMGVAPPASVETIIRYMFTQPLDFPPGTQYAYSNFGYCLLGRIIERVTGERYRDFVRTHILKPMGITDMRPGRTERKSRADGEVVYYDVPGSWLTPSVFPFIRDPVALPDGGFHLEAMDSHGGWLASVVDLMRFLTAVDGRSRRRGFLKPETIAEMTARPPLAEYRDAPTYYALGWQVRPQGNDANWWHTGSLTGSAAIMVRAHNGLAWAALFNSLPTDADAFLAELDRALWKAAEGVAAWPRGDLFNSFR
jgi:N-acyl-D-amino-acid deacylase